MTPNTFDRPFLIRETSLSRIIRLIRTFRNGFATFANFEIVMRKTRARWIFVAAWLLLAGMATAQMHDHASMPAGEGEFNPFIISDNNGGFYLTFVERKAGQNNVMLQHTTVSQKSFTPAVHVNDRAGDGAVRNENPPKIAIGLHNEVFVVWASERERWKGNIRFARSVNGGKSFEPALSLNSDAAGPPVSRAFESIV